MAVAVRLVGSELLESIRFLLRVEDDTVTFDWIEETRAMQLEKSRKNSENGKLGGRGKSRASKPKSERKANALRNENETKPFRAANAVEVEDIQEIKERARERDERFDSLWKVYEGKGAKGKAMIYWRKLSEEDKQAIIAKAPSYVAATSEENLTYRKNLEGWINPTERRWEAPIIQRKVDPPKPKVWTKQEAIEEVCRLREVHGKDFQTHHVPKDVLTAYRSQA